MKILRFLLFLLTPVYLFAQQATWELVRENFYGLITVDPTNSDIIYVTPGNVQFGLHKSVDGGKTWVYYDVEYGTQDGGIVIDPNNPQRLWIYGGPFKGLVRSEDGGMTAVRADTGISFDHHGYSVYALTYDHMRNILYAGDDALIPGGIYRSFDSGRRWDLVAAFGSGLNFISKFLLVEEDRGWVYSGSTGSGIWRSKDFGVSWAPLQPGILSGRPIYFIAKVPNSRTMYAAGGMGQIYKSYDLGEHWGIRTPAILDSSLLVGGLLISSLDTNFVYVGAKGGSLDTKGGFYLSRDGGASWELYHAGLPQYDLSGFHVISLVKTPTSQHLYMSSRFSLLEKSERNIFRLSETLLTAIVEHSSPLKPLDFTLKQNYPNPFNGQTQIEFSLPRRSLIALDIYNIAGEQVTSLIKTQINEGKNAIVWDGKNSKGGDVTSGIYLVRLKFEQMVLTRKLLLIR